ncbi:hypothetical protein MUK42_33660 [Musa troglodytarum]|uniref:Uncharacterized protein n=1 Tax=Musa troglodytarum TaxID=320322 RepID=A0A9E7FYR3_9LILI|nr:hypothetical protein MUK42_33660 [Musa troglodytarum]
MHVIRGLWMLLPAPAKREGRISGESGVSGNRCFANGKHRLRPKAVVNKIAQAQHGSQVVVVFYPANVNVIIQIASAHSDDSDEESAQIYSHRCLLHNLQESTATRSCTTPENTLFLGSPKMMGAASGHRDAKLTSPADAFLYLDHNREGCHHAAVVSLYQLKKLLRPHRSYFMVQSNWSMPKASQG